MATDRQTIGRSSRRRLFALGAASILGLATLGGCGAFDGDNDDNDNDISGRDRISSRDDVVLSGDRDVDVASGTANKVPRDAIVVDSGSNSLTYSARRDGSVYLYDEEARTVIWDARLRDGDRVSVDADNNRIEVNGRSSADIDLTSTHHFRLYFLEGLKSTRDGDRF